MSVLEIALGVALYFVSYEALRHAIVVLTGNEFADMIVDQFDEMLRSSEETPQVMSVITHSFISGQPFRLRALRRALDHIMKSAGSIWFTNPGAIASYFAALPADE